MTFTIEPGSSHLLIPKNGPITVRSKGPYNVWYSRELHMDNLLAPGTTLRVKVPTLFVVVPATKQAERRVILERARREVPALRETVKQNLSDLRRIAGLGERARY